MNNNKSILILNNSILKESALQNNVYSSIKTPTYPNNNSETKPQEKKFTYKFFEKNNNFLESLNNEEDLYYELFDSDLIDFHEKLVNPKKDTVKNSVNPFSTYNDWSKIIQKASVSPEKMSESNAKTNQDSIQEVFRMILSLKERNWYEEVVQLYKVL